MDIEPDVSDVVQRSLTSLVAAWDNTEEVAQIHTGNAIVAVLSEFPIEVARLVASAKQDVPGSGPEMAEEILKLQDRADNAEIYALRVEKAREDWGKACEAMDSDSQSLESVLEKIQELKSQRHRVLCEAPHPTGLLCGRPVHHPSTKDHMAITATGHIVRWAVAE